MTITSVLQTIPFPIREVTPTHMEGVYAFYLNTYERVRTTNPARLFAKHIPKETLVTASNYAVYVKCQKD